VLLRRRPCAQALLEEEARHMFPDAFQQHTSGGTAGSAATCQLAVSNVQETRKMCSFGMDCMRENCWYQHPPGYDRTLAIQRAAGKRIVTVEGGFSADAPLSVTHAAHFADPSRGKIGGGITKPKPKPKPAPEKTGPDVRSDVPASASEGASDDSAAGASSDSAQPEAAAGATDDSAEPSEQEKQELERRWRQEQERQQEQRRQEEQPVEPTVEEVVTVQCHVVPRIIGKGGIKIKEIVTKSGAEIKIDRVAVGEGGYSEEFQPVIIQGRKDRVAVAKLLIQEVVESCELAVEEAM
jgi:hypothetical protein